MYQQLKYILRWGQVRAVNAGVFSVARATQVVSGTRNDAVHSTD